MGVVGEKGKPAVGVRRSISEKARKCGQVMRGGQGSGGSQTCGSSTTTNPARPCKRDAAISKLLVLDFWLVRPFLETKIGDLARRELSSFGQLIFGELRGILIYDKCQSGRVLQTGGEV